MFKMMKLAVRNAPDSMAMGGGGATFGLWLDKMFATVRCLLFSAFCFLLSACFLLLAACCLLFSACCVLLATRCLPCIALPFAAIPPR